jgi:sialic acid synthase SpsE
MSVKIGDKVLSREEERVFIVFEAGPTHDGLDTAKGLIDVAADAKADAIKFQMLDTERLMGQKDVEFSYKILIDKEEAIYEEKRESLYEILKRRELKREEWIELKNYADEKGIMFFCTAVFPDEVDFLVDELGVQSIKMASSDIDHFPLLEYVSKKDVNIQLDTGSGNLWEIERAVRLVERHNRNIIIHHCPSGYPARTESINLAMIPTLKMVFPDYLIAFSDHTPGWDMDMAAIAYGVRLVEKTITFDRTTPSVEHCFSLEPDESKRFVKSVRELEKAIGSSSRTIPEAVLEERRKGRRSIFTKRPLFRGEKITIEDMDFRRPGYGISPSYTDILLGKRVSKDIPADKMIMWDDIS